MATLPKSDLRDGFDEQCRRHGLPIGEREYTFAGSPKRWAYDLAWPTHRIIMEIEGGAFLKGGGRHTRGAGFRDDLFKYNYATRMGYRLLRVMPEHIRCLPGPGAASSQAILWLRDALAGAR